MNSIPDDELLSAYLDGELSDDERARVEQMLAEQPEARQLLDDLRTLSGGFEALPRHRLEADFSARVLRAAEREMLSGEADGNSDGEIRPHIAETAVADRAASRLGWKRWRRPVAWAGFALAAGLLLMVFERGRPPAAVREPVAHAPSAGAEFRAPEEAAEPPAAEEKTGLARNERNAERLLRENEAAPQAAPAPSRARRFAAPAKAAAKPDVALKTGAMGGLGAQRGVQNFNNYNGYFSSYQLATQQNGETVAEPLDPQTLVIWCDVDQNVPARAEFRELLTSNGIVWDDNADFGAVQKKAPAGSFGFNKPADEKSGDAKLAGKELADKKPAIEKPAGARAALQAESERPADYVLLEATEEQLKAVLMEFDRHPELFLTVNVEPSPAAPSQQAFEVYNRARVIAKSPSGPLGEKSPAESLPKLKARAADARQADKGAARFGRAQQVLVLPQQAPLFEQNSPPAEKAEVAGEEAKRTESLDFQAGERLEQRMRATGGEPQTDGKAVQKPRSPAQATKPPAVVAQQKSAAGYQQALIIFRRIPPPAAAATTAPAEAAEQPAD